MTKHWTELTDRDLAPWLPEGKSLRGMTLAAMVYSPLDDATVRLYGWIEYFLPMGGIDVGDETPAVLLGLGDGGSSVVVSREDLRTAEEDGDGWWSVGAAAKLTTEAPS